jgi:hypothetical protein
MGSIMGSQKFMGSDYGSNISVVPSRIQIQKWEECFWMTPSFFSGQVQLFGKPCFFIIAYIIIYNNFFNKIL